MQYDNEAIVREWVERVWNQKDAGAIAEFLTPDTVAHGMGPNGSRLVGAAAFQQAHALFCDAFPDIHLTVGPMISDGDKVASFLTCTATHGGDALGIPASGQQVTFFAMTMARLENGKIVEGWNVIDLLAAFQQIGAMKVSEALP